MNLAQAVDTTRGLTRGGVKIGAITQGFETVLDGLDLGTALGETYLEFEGFPR